MCKIPIHLVYSGISPKNKHIKFWHLEDELAPGQPGQISPRDPGTGDIDVLHMSEVQKREAKGRALRKASDSHHCATFFEIFDENWH